MARYRYFLAVCGILAAAGMLPAQGDREGASPAVQVPNPPLDENRPLGDLGDRMGVVGGRLAARDGSPPVQALQGHIVGHLDDLLERLRKKVDQCCGGDGDGEGEGDGEGNARGRGNNPLNESRLVGGPGGVGELQATGQTTRQFGELPPRLRDKIVQARERGFPSRYADVLEEYYRRLAEQEPRKPAEEPSRDR